MVDNHRMTASRNPEPFVEGDLIFVAQLFAAREPENCDKKECRYRSPWCFAASHAEVYSGVFKTCDQISPNQQKLTRASD